MYEIVLDEKEIAVLIKLINNSAEFIDESLEPSEKSVAEELASYLGSLVGS